VALPGLIRDQRLRYEASTAYREDRPKIKHLRIAQVVPNRHIKNQTDLDQALDALKKAVTDALTEVEVVELD